MQFKKIIYFFFILLLFISQISAQDSIRLMTYNLLNFPDANPARISYLKTILQYSKPDILLVNELSNETGANEVLVNALNTDGINYYSRAPFHNYDIQNNLMYYDTRKVGFLSADTISEILIFFVVTDNDCA